MATILKGYRGNKTGSFEEIDDIASTYEPGIIPMGKKKKGDPKEAGDVEAAKTAKFEALVAKAEEKGWSDKKRMRKGVDGKAKDILDPLSKRAVFKKGQWVGTKDKWGGNLRSEETGKIKKPHISIDKTPVEETKSPQGRLNPFYNMPLGDRIKSRIQGKGPKSDYWVEGFQADHRPGTPYQTTQGKHGDLPTGKTKTKRKINIDWY